MNTMQHSDIYFQLKSGILKAKRLQVGDPWVASDPEVLAKQREILHDQINHDYVCHPEYGLNEYDLDDLHEFIDQDLNDD